jgi:hypothetical protein
MCGCIIVPFEAFSKDPSQDELFKLLDEVGVHEPKRLCIIPGSKRGKEKLVIVHEACAYPDCRGMATLKLCRRYVCLYVCALIVCIDARVQCIDGAYNALMVRTMR